MNLNQLTEQCGKSPPYVMTIQKSSGLPVLKKYSLGYAVLLCKLIWLQIASVSKKEIQSQLSCERKLLELLKIDSYAPSSAWFEDQCKDNWGPGICYYLATVSVILRGLKPGWIFQIGKRSCSLLLKWETTQFRPSSSAWRYKPPFSPAFTPNPPCFPMH